MTKKPISIALRIAEILNDSSEREIATAVKLLREHGWQSGLLSFVSDAAASCESGVGARKKTNVRTLGEPHLRKRFRTCRGPIHPHTRLLLISSVDCSMVRS